MIAQVTGTLVARAPDRIEVMTAGGVAYECLIPLAVFEALPADGGPVALHTHLAVREDGWQLYGFATPYERAVFQRLLAAKGVGPALALGILSALSADRVARALREKDVTTLMRVPRVGRKKAEQIILDLADSLDALGAPPAPSGGAGGSTAPAADDAVRALVALGYALPEADRAVRRAAEGEAGADVGALVRRALAALSAGR
ncbi:MAG: Holliday junction branch migration protein RuvA [Gemmatimonadetes bacterium]|nr:Holliday junction branch migration protein RuvA [Gemmatimonadota bacterium]